MTELLVFPVRLASALLRRGRGRAVWRRVRRPLAAAPAALIVVAASLVATYVVLPDDTRGSLVRGHELSVTDLSSGNGLGDVSSPPAGARLVTRLTAVHRNAPGRTQSRTYVVRSGDTLYSIARRYGTTPAELARRNGLRRPNLLPVGTRLAIPPPRAGSKLPPKLLEHRDRLALMPRFDRWARAYGVPPDVLKAVTWQESGWQNGLVSATGARGIGQLMPDTVRFVSGELLGTPLDAANPNDNIRMSARFLRYLFDAESGRIDRAVAAYYQGLRSVREDGVLRETQHYVRNVQALRRSFR